VTIREICERLGQAISVPGADADAPDRGICPLCEEPVRANQQIAFTGEHLRCYVRQLQPHHASPKGTTDARDRRQHPRFPASWRLRLWFGDLGFADARADNASIAGLCITLPTATTAASLLKPGKTISVEVYDDDRPVFRTAAAVRHRTGTAVGIECLEHLPTELLDRLATAV
jgi:hypothetical protein